MKQLLTKNIKILIGILVVVLCSVILLTVFTKIQNRRISHLRQTLDSLETGKLDNVNRKYFEQGRDSANR